MENFKQLIIYLLQNKNINTNRVKLTLILLVISTVSFSNNLYQRDLKLNFDNTEIENIISYIENTTNYRFLYKSNEIDLKKRINIKYRGALPKGIQLLFNTTSIYPIILNKQIILKRRVLEQQDFELKGIVTEKKSGLPLAQAIVLINEFERGVITDLDGKYKVRVRKGDEISFSFLGYKTQTFTIENQKTINVALEEDFNQLEEVVIGYGKEKKKNISTAISSIKSADLQKNLQSGATFEKGLEGLVKGVLVTQNTGNLGKPANIIIRGISSLRNNNNPLYIIDGVPVTTNFLIQGASPRGNETYNPLQAINPEDITSINILKDAAATSIYGSRGANGVIIVKTNKGNYNQETRVSLSLRTTVARPVNMLDYLSTSEFKEYILQKNKNTYEYYLNFANSSNPEDIEYAENYAYDVLSGLSSFGFKEDFNTGGYTYNPNSLKFGNANTNWNKEVFRSGAFINNINISVSGGSEKSFYNFSMGYTNQEGIIKSDKNQIYNIRLSGNFDISERIKSGVTINYTFNDLKGGFSNSSVDYGVSYMGDILKFRPDIPVYDKNNNYTYVMEAGKRRYNPVAITTLNDIKSQKTHNVLADLFAELHITKSLKFKTEFNIMTSFDRLNSFSPKEYALEGYTKGETKSNLFLSDIYSTNTTFNHTLDYEKYNKKHSFRAMVGFSHNLQNNERVSSRYQDFLTNTREPQFAKIKLEPNKDSEPYGINSFFGRVSYGFKDKYGVIITSRLDRSSKFAPENRNAFFPSISAHWNLHNEDFIKNNIFDELKLRGSYGHTGNAIGNSFAYLQTFDSSSGTSFTYNGNTSTDFSQNFANRRLNWETTKEYNIGIDFNLKKEILRGSIDFYNKKTFNVVSNDKAVAESGSDFFEKNNATIQNKGFEIDLGSTIINKKNLQWNIDVNASKNINKVLAVSDELTKGVNQFDDVLVIGKEIGVIKGYVVNGIINSKERLDELNQLSKSKGNSPAFYQNKGTVVGDYEYKDLNNDGKIDLNDRTIIGSSQPDLFGGIRTQIQYKGLNLGLNFSYSLGQESLRRNESSGDTQNFGKFDNIERFLSQNFRWSPENPSAKLPRLIHRIEYYNNLNSSADIFDASYLRLTSIRLGYELPFETIQKIGFKNANIYITGNNLFTWTNFPGINPQGGLYNEDAYPSSKSITLGINLKL